jgi:hypothetical protein
MFRLLAVCFFLLKLRRTWLVNRRFGRERLHWAFFEIGVSDPDVVSPDAYWYGTFG